MSSPAVLILSAALAQSAPPPVIDLEPYLPALSDLDRFPSASEAREQVCRHRQHLRWLEQCRSLPVLDARCGHDWNAQQLAATHKRLAAWEILANVKAASPEAFRWWGIPPRGLLAMLRDELGWEDYEKGRMPEALPAILYDELPLPLRPPPARPAVVRTAGTANR
jgi:hypothetical protein